MQVILVFVLSLVSLFSVNLAFQSFNRNAMISFRKSSPLYVVDEVTSCKLKISSMMKIS